MWVQVGLLIMVVGSTPDCCCWCFGSSMSPSYLLRCSDCCSTYFCCWAAMISFFFCWFVCCTSYSGLLELQYIIAGRVGLLQLTYATFAMDCCLLWMPPRAPLLGFL